MMIPRVRPDTGSLASGDAGGADVPALLLTEVDFKWLMAGQGWWINLQRLNGDPLYAAEILHSALTSPCAALRECAALLQAQLGRAATQVH
jgi:hypothetical protein